MKAAVLRAYELVPEAYRQRFRSCSKSAKQTFVEFAREKRMLFKWCFATKTTTFEELQELVLLEDFKSCVPESLVVHLNEKRIFKLSEAAILSDKFILTHKTVFPSVHSVSSPPVSERTIKELQRVARRFQDGAAMFGRRPGRSAKTAFIYFFTYF